jgi:hypothetical protein
VFLILIVARAALPNEERWAPYCPDTCEIGVDKRGRPLMPTNWEDALEDQGGPIVFEGIVSAPGRYGHMGIMRRRVEMVRILRYKKAEAQRGH